LLSHTTARIDRTTKKALYEQTFHTPEYFLYDPATRQLEGWTLVDGSYRAIRPDARGWLWSAVLQLWLGTWNGPFQEVDATWLRFYDEAGKVILIEAEAAQAKLEQTEARLQQAEASAAEAVAKLAEQDAELARLRAVLAEKGTPPTP
jgi:hypothetical protein